MENFRSWYIRNQDAISWFFVGWFTAMGVDQLACEMYGSAASCFAIAGINWYMTRQRLTAQ
jgi:hypothetical protein